MNRTIWEINEYGLYIPGLSWFGENPRKYPYATAINESYARVSYGNIWGCVDKSAKLIIPLKYDVIYYAILDNEEYFICGRDGNAFMGRHNEYDTRCNKLPESLETFFCTSKYSSYEDEREMYAIWGDEYKDVEIYTGKYDLYNAKGEFLIGGFNDILFEKNSKLFFFLFGREWHLNISKESYYFDDSNSKWIVLNNKFNLIANTQTQNEYERDLYEESYSFKGQDIRTYLVNLSTKSESYLPTDIVSNLKYNKVTDAKDELIVDFPETFVFEELHRFDGNRMIIKKKDKYRLIDLGANLISKGYDYIELTNIQDYSVILEVGSGIGLLKNTEEVLECRYDIFTEPINNWFFAFKAYSSAPIYVPNHIKEYCGFLFNEKPKQSSKNYFAIEKIDEITLEKFLKCSAFKLKYCKGGDSINNLRIEDPSLKEFFVENLNTLFMEHTEQSADAYDKTNEIYYVTYDKMYKILDEIKNPKEPIYYDDYDYYDDYYSDDSDILDALDGEWDAYWNID